VFLSETRQINYKVSVKNKYESSQEFSEKEEQCRTSPATHSTTSKALIKARWGLCIVKRGLLE
jgi:nitrogen fixation protein FixH